MVVFETVAEETVDRKMKRGTVRETEDAKFSLARKPVPRGDRRTLSRAGAEPWPTPKLPFLTSGPSGLLPSQLPRRTRELRPPGESPKAGLAECPVTPTPVSARARPHGNAAKHQFERARRRPPARCPAAPTNGCSGCPPSFAACSSRGPIGDPRERGAEPPGPSFHQWVRLWKISRRSQPESLRLEEGRSSARPNSAARPSPAGLL